MFDVVVIGGGPGGYKSAELLAKQKKSVALIEENQLGGACLNQGCIPFKSYLHITKTRFEADKLVNTGLAEGNVFELNQKVILNNKNRIIKALQQSVEMMLKANGVVIYHGHAKVVKNTAQTVTIEVAGDILECKKLVIATGSEERQLFPIAQASGIISSKEMLELEILPQSIDIVGGGAIGLEAASYYADAGCKVSVIEASDHIGGNTDLQISEALRKILEKKGITILTETNLDSIDSEGVTYQHDGKIIKNNPQYVLMAVGRKPRLDEDVLSQLDIKYDHKGIEIDDECLTSNPNVYACGDVTGKLMLAHTAYRQAKVITDSICGKKSIVDYSIIPRVIYTNPEVLCVGYSEEECKEREIEYIARSIPMTYSGRYFAENGKDGAMAKMILDKNNRILGFHMIANGASEFSLAVELMISAKMSTDDIANLVFAHPTYSEIVSDLVASF